MAAIKTNQDLSTIDRFAHVVCRVSRRTLQRRCQEADVTAGDCLDFARCARFVLRDHRRWDPGGALHRYYADARTVRRLLIRAGLREKASPAFREFLDRQTLIRPRALLGEIRRALDAD